MKFDLAVVEIGEMRHLCTAQHWSRLLEGAEVLVGTKIGKMSGIVICAKDYDTCYCINRDQVEMLLALYGANNIEELNPIVGVFEEMSTEYGD